MKSDSRVIRTDSLLYPLYYTIWDMSDQYREKDDSSSSDDSELDAKSDKFNPMKALYSPKIKVVPGAKLFDNLTAFESHLVKLEKQKANASHNRDSPKPSTSTMEDFDQLNMRRFLPHQRPIQGGGLKPKHLRNIFTKMEEFDGPLGALNQMTDERVVVHTRKEHGVRGTITGLLICFDKHWNLLICDAVEIWKRRKFKYSENKMICGAVEDCTKRLKKLGIRLPQTEVKCLNRKYVECTRTMNTILIRGEQVVMVTRDSSKET